jgi:anti-sigma factor RsiW
MTKLPPLDDNDREDLIAYLDGELDDEAARAVEVRLNLDADARAEAETLRRTWDLLDYLPRPEPSPAFTNQTLERISAFRSPAPAAAGAVAWRPWIVGLGWAAAVLLVAAGAFMAVSGWPFVSNGTDQIVDLDQLLVQELRMIENKRLYEQGEDVPFIRALADPDLFGEDL